MTITAERRTDSAVRDCVEQELARHPRVDDDPTNRLR